MIFLAIKFIFKESLVSIVYLYCRIKLQSRPNADQRHDVGKLALFCFEILSNILFFKIKLNFDRIMYVTKFLCVKRPALKLQHNHSNGL